MSLLGVVCVAMWLATPPPLLAESLQVEAEDPALGELIVRAARRYLHGTVDVAAPTAISEPASRWPPRLSVRQEPGEPKGQRWLLVLSSGPQQKVRRLLLLGEVPSSFDLAEAVAIDLPVMLATLEAQAPDGTPRADLPMPQVSPPPRIALAGVPRPLPASRALVPPREEVQAAAVRAPRSQETSPTPIRADGQDSAPAQVPKPQPPGPAPEKRTGEVTPKKTVLAAPEKTAVVAPTSQAPAPAIGLVSFGTVALLTGAATGIAALVTAQQIDSPTSMRFDAALDRRGKALDTASIVLDCAGAASLLGGGAWLLYVRARKPRAPQVSWSLIPAGRTLLLGGTF